MMRFIELLNEKRIFRWNRKSLLTKSLAILIYQAGLSYRKTRRVLNLIEEFSHESVGKWYTKCKELFDVKRRWRRAVAVDETKVKLENSQIYIWNAIDVDSRVILAVHVSETRTTLDAIYFLKRVLERCENKPLILVDKGPWYRFALERLGLQYKHQRFGERNAIEQWYGLLKSRLKSFWKRFPYNSSLQSIKSWIVAWCAIYNLMEVRNS